MIPPSRAEAMTRIGPHTKGEDLRSSVKSAQTCALWFLSLFRTQEQKFPVLPAAEVAALGLPQTGECPVEFPDGSHIIVIVHPAQVLLMGEAHQAGILDGRRISMRFVPGEAVEAERL